MRYLLIGLLFGRFFRRLPHRNHRAKVAVPVAIFTRTL